MNNLNSTDWILIKRTDIIDLIQNAKDRRVPAELLEAMYQWLNEKNQLTNETDEI